MTVHVKRGMCGCSVPGRPSGMIGSLDVERRRGRTVRAVPAPRTRRERVGIGTRSIACGMTGRYAVCAVSYRSRSLAECPSVERGYVRWLHVRACAVHTGQSPRSNQSLHETLNTTVCAAPQPDHTQHTHGTHPGFPCFRNIDFPSEHTTDTFASKDTLHASLSTSLSSSFLSSSYLSSLTWERGPRSHVPRL